MDPFTGAAITLFQFHKGTIRTPWPARTPSAIVNFNSIKVRLEHRWERTDWIRSSHFNSIKVRLELSEIQSRIMLNEFQFHKGTIRTLLSWFSFEVLCLFQFHKGTIRTWKRLRSPLLVCTYFNSIKVRLELFVVIINVRFKLFQFHKGTIRT